MAKKEREPERRRGNASVALAKKIQHNNAPIVLRRHRYGVFFVVVVVIVVIVVNVVNVVIVVVVVCVASQKEEEEKESRKGRPFHPAGIWRLPIN